jgi:hypothetical protein
VLPDATVELTQVGAAPAPLDCRIIPAVPAPLPMTTVLLKVTLETKVCPAVQTLVEAKRPAAPEPVIAWQEN